jgi:predicted amidophosphoribosyltransferase
LTLATYLVVLGGILLLCLLAMRFVVAPMRLCPRCDSRIKMSSASCRYCGYALDERTRPRGRYRR